MSSHSGWRLAKTGAASIVAARELSHGRRTAWPRPSIASSRMNRRQLETAAIAETASIPHQRMATFKAIASDAVVGSAPYFTAAETSPTSIDQAGRGHGEDHAGERIAAEHRQRRRDEQAAEQREPPGRAPANARLRRQACRQPTAPDAEQRNPRDRGQRQQQQRQHAQLHQEEMFAASRLRQEQRRACRRCIRGRSTGRRAQSIRGSSTGITRPRNRAVSDQGGDPNEAMQASQPGAIARISLFIAADNQLVGRHATTLSGLSVARAEAWPRRSLRARAPRW